MVFVSFEDAQKSLKILCMKNEILPLLLLNLALVVTVCLGQVNFSDTITSQAGETTYKATEYGKFVTISTDNGFSWVVSDTLASSYEVYATLVCVSTGSTTDTGLVQRVTGGYPDSYSVESQVLPVFGKNFPSLYSDTIAFYAPSKPTKANGLNFGMTTTTYSAGKTIHFTQTSLSLDITISSEDTGSMTMDSGDYGLSFELVNCGTAVWCIQDASQYGSNPGDCDPGNAAPTCPVSTTCSSPEYKTECSSASTLYIKDYSCLTQCPSDTSSVSVKTGVYVCGPCSGECSGTGTTTAESGGFATWKLCLAIALPVIAVLCCFVCLFLVLGARARRRKEQNQKFNPVPSHPTSPTIETLHTQV